MPPTEVPAPPCKIVFARLDRTRVYVNVQFRNSVFDGRLSLSGLDRLLIGVSDLHFICVSIRSNWQLDRKRQQTAGNLDRLDVWTRASRVDRASGGRVMQIKQCYFVLRLRRWRGGHNRSWLNCFTWLSR